MVIRGLPEKNQGQDGKRRALAPCIRVLRISYAYAPRRKIGRGMARINHTNRPDEAVPFAYDCFQKAWFIGIVNQGRTNFSDDVVDVQLGIDEQMRAP